MPKIAFPASDSLEFWPPSSLIPYGGNPNTHPDEQIQKLVGLIREFGFLVPILVSRADREIVAGHGRTTAALLLEEAGELDTVPVIAIDHLSADQRRAWMVADKSVTDLSEWDPEALARELRAIDTNPDLTLDLVGFDQEELERLERELLETAKPRKLNRKRSVTAEVVSEDPDEAPSDPIPVEGDLWLAGTHRLLVADSTSRGSISKATAKVRADCVVTDPPFAIFGSSTGVGSDVADDRMVEPFFRKVASLIRAGLKLHGHAYVFCDWRSYPTLATAARKRLTPANLLVWHKPGSGLGSNWGNAHELVAFFHHRPERSSSWQDTQPGHRSVNRANVLEHDRAGRGPFEREREGGRKAGSAAKPVDLLVDLIQASTDPGELVLDPFTGTGSTLVACEASERRFAGVEVDPGTAELALRRWERLTGQQAELKGGGTLDEVGEDRRAEAAK